MGAEAGSGAVGRWFARRASLLLLAGLAIREAFSFWTGNPYDFEVWVRTGAAVARGQNPYNSFWPPVPGTSFAFLNEPLAPAAYPPFWPAIAGLLYSLWEHVGGGNRFVLYFLLKQPTILGDVATAVLLGRTVRAWGGSPEAADRAQTFWALFPYAIVISGIWGQIDPILVALLLFVLGLGTTAGRTVAEGVGVFVKWLTAIFAPLEFFREKGARRLYAGLVLIVPLLLTIAAFVAEGWSLTGIEATTTSQAHGGGGGMNLAAFFDNPAVAAYLLARPLLLDAVTYAWLPAVVLGGLLGARWCRGSSPGRELRAMLFVTTLFMALRWGLYEQYMLYVFALLYLDVVVFHPGRARLLLLLIVEAATFLLVNNDLGIWFASPLDGAAFTYSVHLDQATTLGAVRADALLVIAVLVTLTLVQLAVALYRDEPAPRPWPWLLLGRGARPVAASEIEGRGARAGP